jgi:MFS family permease
VTAQDAEQLSRLDRRWNAILGPAVASGGTTFLAIGLVDSIGTGMYLAGSALFFTIIVGLSAGQVGIGLSVAGLLGFLTQPVIGWLADRWGPRRLLILVNLYRAGGFTAYIFVGRFTSFLIVAALLSIAEQAVAPVYQALAEQIAGPEKRVGMMARLRVVFNVGFTAGALLASVAIGVGTRLAFDMIMLGNAASFVIAAMLLAGMRTSLPAAPTGRAPRFAPLRLHALRDGRYMAVASANGLLTLHVALLGIGVPLWVSQHTTAPKALVGLLLVVNTVLAVLFQVRAARGTENAAGSVSAMRKGAVALVVACALFALAPKLGSHAGVIAFLLLGLAALTAGELFQSAGGWGLSYALAPGRSRAEYLATFNLGMSAQLVLGPAIVTVGVVGHGTVGWLVLATCFLAAGVVVGPLAAMAERRPALAAEQPEKQEPNDLRS